MRCHPARAHFPPFNCAVTGKNPPLIRQCYLIKMPPRLACALITTNLGRGEMEGKEGRDRSRGGKRTEKLDVHRRGGGGGGGPASCRAAQWLEGRAAGGGYHDTKKGGTDVAFDFTDILNGIRPHHVRVFVCLPPSIVPRACWAPSPVCLLVSG